MRLTRTRIQRALPVGGVARDFAFVGGATALGQGALVLVSPLLTRLYDPAAFGALSVYSATIGIALAVASLRFDLAIPLADDDSEAAGLLTGSLLIALVVTAIFAVALAVAGPAAARALGVEAMVPFLWLVPLGLLAASVAQVVASWGIYQRNFSALGRMRALQGAAQAAGQVGMGSLGAGPAGLLVGDVIGRTLGTEQLLRPLVRFLRSTRPTLASTLGHLRGRWGFARLMAVASLLNALSLQVPYLLIPGWFNLDASGQYFLAYRLLVLPASLVGAAVSQVFFGEASHRREVPARLRTMAINVAVSLFLFSIPTYGVVLAAGPELIRLVFGPTWADAGTFARLMAPGLMLWAVASPISTLLLVGRRERESLGFTVAELALKVACLAAGAAAGSLWLAIAALSAATVLINVGALWRIMRAAGASIADLVRPVIQIALVAVPACVAVFLVRNLPGVWLLVAAAVAWAIATGAVVARSAELRMLFSDRRD